MTKGYFKTITATCFILVIMLAFTACNADPAADGSDIETIDVTLSILYPENAEKENLQQYPMQVQEHATVMQILESYSDQANVAIRVEDSEIPRVTAIDGITASDGFQWSYEVNGKNNFEDTASDHELKDGDSIVWKYE